MSRSNAAFDHAPSNDTSANDDGFAPSEAPTWAEDKNPTRPLPVFRLEEEARRLDSEAAARAQSCDEDSTVTVSAEENKKLLASVFAAASNDRAPSPIGDRRCTEDDPTLDAPSPATPEAIAALCPRPVRVTARPPALKMLVITRPAPTPVPRTEVAPSAVITSVPAGPVTFPRAVPSLVMSSITPVAAPVAALVAPPASGFRSKITPELAQAARELRDAEERRRSAGTIRVRLPKRNAMTYVVAGIWAMALSLLAVLMFMATSA